MADKDSAKGFSGAQAAGSHTGSQTSDAQDNPAGPPVRPARTDYKDMHDAIKAFQGAAAHGMTGLMAVAQKAEQLGAQAAVAPGDVHNLAGEIEKACKQMVDAMNAALPQPPVPPMQYPHKQSS